MILIRSCFIDARLDEHEVGVWLAFFVAALENG